MKADKEGIGSYVAVVTDTYGMSGLLHECWDLNSTSHGREANTHNHRAVSPDSVQ